jgi:hypothetical protein
MCSQLPLTGATFDELTDLNISRSIATTHDVFVDQNDPSQGRLSHILTAVVMSRVQDPLLALKGTSVAVMLATALLLLGYLRTLVAPAVAALVVAALLVNGYVLGSARAGATAGDALVLATWLAVVLASVRWDRLGARWRGALPLGLFLGVATGAKWSSAVLALLPCFLVIWRHRRSWPYLLVVALVAWAAACAANPLFLQGPAWMLEALRSAHGLDAGTEYWYLGASRPGPPWFFLPALMLVKLGPVWLALAALGAWLSLRAASPHRVLAAVCLLAAASAVPFAVRPFQNAFYYVGTVGPLALLAALGLDHLRRTRARLVPWVALVLLGTSLAQSLRVRPDFLQTGSEWGDVMQGEFSGPAINHCQGMPMAAAEIASLVAAGATHRAFALLECRPQWDMAMRAANLDVEWAPRPLPLPRPHLLVVPRLVHFFLRGDAMRAGRERDSAAALRGCRPVRGQTAAFDAGRPYELFQCE